MSKRILIIAISFILIVGLSIGGFWAVQRSPKLQNTVAKLANVPTTNTTVITNSTTNTPSPSLQIMALSSMAKVFAERYGSTSNQDPEALLTVVPYTSTRLATILRSNISDLSSRAKPTVEIVTVTKAYVVSPSAVTSSSATVVVETVRQETVTGGATKNTKQNLILGAIRENNRWVIDQVRWGEATAYGS